MAEQKPHEEDAPIQINFAWCKACGICIEFCPKKVYGRNVYGQPEILDKDKCNQCMLCVERCPEFAIEVKKVVRPKKAAG